MSGLCICLNDRVVRAAVTSKTHGVMIAKRCFGVRADGRVRWPCLVLAFMIVGFGTLGLCGIGEMASHRFRVYFFALSGLVYSLILHGIGWIGSILEL